MLKEILRRSKRLITAVNHVKVSNLDILWYLLDLYALYNWPELAYPYCFCQLKIDYSLVIINCYNYLLECHTNNWRLY